MELERREHLAMIYYGFRRGLSPEEYLKQLLETFSDAVPSRETIFRWCTTFRRGKESLQDYPHPGRPQTAVLPETISTVEEVLKVDGQMK